MGYISGTAIDAILNGEEADLSDAVFVYELTPGEGQKMELQHRRMEQ